MKYSILQNPLILNENDWKRFVNEHPAGNIFYLPEMLNLYNSTSGSIPVFLACVDSSDVLQGLIIGVIQSSKVSFLRSFTSRCIIWGGPLVKDNSTLITDLLLQELNKTISKKTVYIQFRNLVNVLYSNQVFINNNYRYEDHLDILINLRKGENLLWKDLHATRKKQISRSIKRGCSVEVKRMLDDASLHKCYYLLKETYHRIGLPYPEESFFKSAFVQLAGKNYIRVFLAMHSGEIIAFRFLLVYKELIYDWYAASDQVQQDKYPNDLLPWEILTWGTKNGFTIFDFGGAGRPEVKYSVRDYKMKFGGELVNYGRYNKINKPMLFLIGKTVLRTSQLLKSLL